MWVGIVIEGTGENKRKTNATIAVHIFSLNHVLEKVDKIT